MPHVSSFDEVWMSLSEHTSSSINEFGVGDISFKAKTSSIQNNFQRSYCLVVDEYFSSSNRRALPS